MAYESEDDLRGVTIDENFFNELIDCKNSGDELRAQLQTSHGANERWTRLSDVQTEKRTQKFVAQVEFKVHRKEIQEKGFSLLEMQS